MKTVTKTVDELLTLEFEFARTLEAIWREGEEYSVTAPDYVRPTVPNGYEYECTATGQSGSNEPVWPLTLAATVNDGSVQWTTRAFGTNATDTISAQTVTAPSGLTLASAAIDGTKVTVDVSAGVLGEDYEVSCKIDRVGGETYEEIMSVQIRRPKHC